jgi:hypothetical protein
VKSATNDSTEEACKCILEYYTLIICGFFSVTFFIENQEEGRLPLLIISSSLPEILEECVHVFNAIRWQCLESFCWDTRFTWRLVVSKFSDMIDNFRMNTRSGGYGAAYNMVALLCFNEELSLLPKNPTEAKLQATSTRGESTEPT